jgi:non-heme chloroperoxidase
MSVRPVCLDWQWFSCCKNATRGLGLRSTREQEGGAQQSRRFVGRTLWRAVLWCLLAFFVGGVSRAAEGVSDRFFRTSDGVKLHYLEAGRGPETMVFIPGWLMPAVVFEAQVRELSRRFRVISFDPRSQGKSEVFSGAHTPEARCRDIHELLKVVKPTRPILAGWSLGVMEVLDYLAHYQVADLAGLVLIDNSIGEGRPPGSGGSSKSGSGSSGPRDRSAYLRDFTLSLTKKPLTDPLFKAIYASTLQVPQEAARELLRKPYPREYWRDTLLAQSVPVLYTIRPRYEEQGEALLRKRPSLAKVELFNEAGHALFLDEPTRFNSVVTAFAEKTWALAPKAR